MKRYDIIAAAVIIVLAGLIWLANTLLPQNKNGLHVEVYEEGVLKQVYPLETGRQEIRIDTRQGYNILQIAGAGAKITEADCYSQTCIHTGEITRYGEAIACLPHRLVIKIAGEYSQEEGLDAVAK